MSCNYADGLSPYHDKGQLGLEEKFDSKSAVSTKVSLLTKWVNEASHVVIHTGAGISTSAGIPDFRGPKGVWTLEAKGEKPDLNKDFNEAIPTITHMAIMKLVEKQKVKYVVSQNIDGLHLRSNLQRKYLSELHGNMFTEQCNSCNRQFVRSKPVPTVGQKSLNKGCPATKANGRPCRGRMHDTILDWEHNLPENDLGMADYHSCLADLSICLGTTMQIVPSGNLPLYTKRHGGKLVIVNLQPTKHDRKANLLIHAYVDEVMTLLMKNLGIKIPKYSPKNDPTRTLISSGEKFLEWTISDHALKKMKKIYEEKCGSKEARKRLEMIYDDIPLDMIKNMKRKIKDEDSDLEVLDVIVKPKKGRDSSRKSSKKSSSIYNTTITIKKVVPPPPKKVKYEGGKITIKKNVTPTKTKYEIVKPKKIPKCEIVYCDDGDVCTDLDMICESDDDDEMTNNFTYNFKMYLNAEKKNIKTEGVTEESKTVNLIENEVKIEKEKETQIKNEKGLEKEPDGKEDDEEIGEELAEIESVIIVENLEEDLEEVANEKTFFDSSDNLEEEKSIREDIVSEMDKNEKTDIETILEADKTESNNITLDVKEIAEEQRSVEPIEYQAGGQITILEAKEEKPEAEIICLDEENNEKLDVKLKFSDENLTKELKVEKTEEKFEVVCAEKKEIDQSKIAKETASQELNTLLNAIDEENVSKESEKKDQHSQLDMTNQSVENILLKSESSGKSCAPDSENLENEEKSRETRSEEPSVASSTDTALNYASDSGIDFYNNEFTSTDNTTNYNYSDNQFYDNF